jgi:hypothetical protein
LELLRAKPIRMYSRNAVHCAHRCHRAHGLQKATLALLAARRACPDAWDSKALRVAACRGHVRVLQALLADGRADPAARNDAALRTAALVGHVRVMQLLLTDSRTVPRAVTRCDAAAWSMVLPAVRWRNRRAWIRGASRPRKHTRHNARGSP